MSICDTIKGYMSVMFHYTEFYPFYSIDCRSVKHFFNEIIWVTVNNIFAMNHMAQISKL
jgi:hypothetical protein